MSRPCLHLHTGAGVFRFSSAITVQGGWRFLWDGAWDATTTHPQSFLGARPVAPTPSKTMERPCANVAFERCLLVHSTPHEVGQARWKDGGLMRDWLGINRCLFFGFWGWLFAPGVGARPQGGAGGLGGDISPGETQNAVLLPSLCKRSLGRRAVDFVLF